MEARIIYMAPKRVCLSTEKAPPRRKRLIGDQAQFHMLLKVLRAGHVWLLHGGQNGARP